MSVADPPAASNRVRSVDLIRGVVMVLMAIDHVRLYGGVPAGGATAGLFFTRWVTNFCAPVFVFFAGTSAFYLGRKLGDVRALSRYLLTRGLMLVVLELTFIRFTWTFNLSFSRFMLAGVIWMLGWCMVLLAPLVRFTPRTVGITGLALVFFQQIFGYIPRALPQGTHEAIGPLWNFIYPAGVEGWKAISILYVIVPWIGVMAAGYGFGLILTRDAASRDRICIRLGIAATVLFAIIATVVVLTGASPRNPTPVLFRVLNQQKYPASQLFLMMTLGPAIALIPLAERARGWFADVMATFGRVPMAYYLMHIPLIHVAALITMQLRFGSVKGSWYATAPFAGVPPDHRWSLPLLYLVWAIVVALLYPACRWYANTRARNPRSWMRFV